MSEEKTNLGLSPISILSNEILGLKKRELSFRIATEFGYLALVALILCFLVAASPLRATPITDYLDRKVFLGSFACKYQGSDRFNEEKLFCENEKSDRERLQDVDLLNTNWIESYPRLLENNSLGSPPRLWAD